MEVDLQREVLRTDFCLRDYFIITSEQLAYLKASSRSPHFPSIVHFSNSMSLCWLTFSNLAC